MINIILEDSPRTARPLAYASRYYQGDGDTVGASATIGAPLGPQGFLDLTAESRFHSNDGGADPRVIKAVNSGAHPDWADLDNYPFVNKVFGDARYTLQLLMANAGYQLSPGTQA